MFTITNEKEVQPVGCVLPNTLVHGDCLEVMKYIPDGSIDLVLCDPPYGTVIPFEPLWAQYRRITKPNAAIVLTASQPFTSILGASNIEMLRYSWVWRKTAATGHLNAKRMPMKNHEDVLVFYAKQPTYNPQGLSDFGRVVRRGGNGGCYGDSGKKNTQEKTGYPRTVQEFGSAGKTVHPTQKPVALMEYLIRTYTNEGETVLDNCAGSFTTGVACLNTGRRFIGIERDDGYFRIGSDRMAKRQVELQARGG
jgi:site-specific DNA-methyltransferase (adenine-specific)